MQKRSRGWKRKGGVHVELSEEQERRQYALAAAREIAETLVGPLMTAIEAIQVDPGKKVRLAATVSVAVDGQSGMIRPELSCRQSVTTETRQLPPVPLRGQLVMFHGDSNESEAAA